VVHWDLSDVFQVETRFSASDRRPQAFSADFRVIFRAGWGFPRRVLERIWYFLLFS
jgi:hypothetical protein